MAQYGNNPGTPNSEWSREKEDLLGEVHDLKILYETVAEHSSTIENELEQKNQEISSLIQQLKKYLSPQLYNLIVGKTGNASLNYNRKFLTIFFSDIVGFTEISDRTDPEVLSELLNGYLNEMAQIAIKYGGTIDKFIGDALMIFFGDPEYTSDQKHAQDCCQMGLEMQSKIEKIDQQWIRRGIPQGLKVRMGIHSGYCTVGNFGSENRMDYTIIGGNVNIASRLESLAGPKSIFISSVTKNLLSQDFISHFNQTFQVKGIHYPIEVFELLGYKKVKHPGTNPYLLINRHGFVLEKIIFDNASSNPEKLKQIEKALKSLLSHIEKYNSV